jgi:hypothetical protein
VLKRNAARQSLAPKRLRPESSKARQNEKDSERAYSLRAFGPLVRSINGHANAPKGALALLQQELEEAKKTPEQSKAS